MKKIWLLGAVVLLLIATLCACGSGDTEVKPSQEIASSDGNFSVSVPEDWYTYDATEEEDLILSIWNYNAGYAKIYFLSNEYYDYPIASWVTDMKEYYGEYMIGDVEEKTIDGLDAYSFQYSMVDISETGDEYNYHGYEYWIDTPLGVVNVDINYAQTKLEDKVSDPSESDLMLLTRIAESFKVN